MSVLGFFSPEEENGYLSNWYLCEFKYGRYTYSSTEQFMMAQKALLFRDFEIFEKVLKTTSPKTLKRLGKQVKNYDDEIWSKVRHLMMHRGIRAKFQQNPDILEKLIDTDNAVLAECSPYDKIWGIGLAVDDARIHEVTKWKGKNLLGNILMDVRTELKSWLANSSNNITYIDATDLPANEIWSMSTVEAHQLPKIKEAIDIYAMVVNYDLRNVSDFDFLSCEGTLNDLEYSMRTNMGGGLPVTWFYEMKQDIYDIVRFG